MIPQSPVCRQALSTTRLSAVSPNASPLVRLSLWSVLPEALLPHSMKRVLQQQQLIVHTYWKTLKSSNAANSGSGCGEADGNPFIATQHQQLALTGLSTASEPCLSVVSYTAAKAAAAAAVAASTAVAGALGRYLWIYKPRPSLLQALLGLATHRKVFTAATAVV